MAAAMREEFAEELAQAEAAAAAVAAEAEQGVTAEQLQADDPEMQQFLSLKQQYHEALQEMGECTARGFAHPCRRALLCRLFSWLHSATSVADSVFYPSSCAMHTKQYVALC
jgi:hypothetical protein